MLKQIFRIVTALAALLQVSLANYYHVEILMELQPGYPIPCCKGAIIYEKLIITTAKCMHFQFGPNGKPMQLDPSVLSVLAGTTNAFIDALRVNVSEIHIAENFDPYTLENDLALLTLSQSLPLGTRPDMKWIMLDDNVHLNHSCLANFFSRNSQHAVPTYYQTEELTMYNNEICRNFTEHPHARQDDICSIYVLPQQLNCPEAEAFLAFNTDRGTGLVCKSYLVGLLSTVVTRPSSENNCTDVALAAIYTNIFPHLMWVYSIMANIETEFISTPYEASLKSLVINTTNDKEVLTTTLPPLIAVNVTNTLNSTATKNSTINNPNSSNSTTSNSTIIRTNSTSTTLSPVSTNSTTWNHPITNSTATNSTTGNSTTTCKPPLSLNATDTNSTSTNTTIRAPPTAIYPTVRTVPNTEPAITDTYIKDPPPTVRNFFKNTSTSVRFSAGCLLIALVSLRLINIYH